MIEDYIKFSNDKEKLAFMKKYGLASKTMSTIPKLYHKRVHEQAYKPCELLGYEKEYETWCAMVVDYGNGPTGIHSDFLRDMQTLERKKGNSLKNYADSFVVFDFETTGINLKECEIIQIGAIKYVKGVEVAKFDEFVRPNNPIPAKITELTGITELHVYNADNIEIVLKKFLDFIGNDILVGFNIGSFDTTLLYDHAKHLFNIDVSNDYIDLLPIARSYFKKNNICITDCKLTTIANHFGFDTTNAHWAIDDCYITAECYFELFNVTQPLSESIVTKINNITNEFEHKVYDILQDIIIAEDLPSNCLYLASNISNKGPKRGQEISKSICVSEPDYPLNSNNGKTLGKNDTFAQIMDYSNNLDLKIRNKYLGSIAIPSTAQSYNRESEKLFTHIIFSKEDISIYPFIKLIVLEGLRLYESSSSFGCCSQFLKCSDEKRCVHENRLYSKGCKYRSNLEAGRIFYGKNRNIDT